MTSMIKFSLFVTSQSCIQCFETIFKIFKNIKSIMLSQTRSCVSKARCDEMFSLDKESFFHEK